MDCIDQEQGNHPAPRYTKVFYEVEHPHTMEIMRDQSQKR